MKYKPSDKWISLTQLADGKIYLLLDQHKVKPCFPHTLVADSVAMGSFQTPGQSLFPEEHSKARRSCQQLWDLSHSTCLDNAGWALIAVLVSTANLANLCYPGC